MPQDVNEHMLERGEQERREALEAMPNGILNPEAVGLDNDRIAIWVWKHFWTIRAALMSKPCTYSENVLNKSEKLNMTERDPIEWIAFNAPEWVQAALSKPCDAQPALQEGWVMVPIEPTEEMLKAANDQGYEQYDGEENYCGTSYDMGEVWKAMLGALIK